MITCRASNSNGRARHFVRAVVRMVDRRAEDCPPYRVRCTPSFVPHENRTSLPGSISKSSVSESSVFGLTTSSTNFT